MENLHFFEFVEKNLIFLLNKTKMLLSLFQEEKILRSRGVVIFETSLQYKKAKQFFDK